MLQLAHSSSCVRHALVALSAYHERFRMGDGGDETYQSGSSGSSSGSSSASEAHGLRQYNMAIRALRVDPTMHLQLVSCTIFVCIEILRRNMTNAISLFKHGCALVRSVSATDPSIDKTLRLIEAFFSRIATQVFLVIGGDRDHSLAKTILPLLERSSGGTDEASTQRTISSIAEAREWLLQLAVAYGRDMPPPAVTALARRFAAWSSAFDAFRRSINKSGRVLGPAERRALALLELHRRYLSINIAALDQEDREDPSSWDQWTDEFREMVGFAEEAAADDNDGPRFYLEIGVLPALFFLCAKCRDPETRRRAIELMARGRVQEGIWGSDMAAKVARRVVALEGGLGGGGGAVVAGDARVRRIAVHADAETLSVGYELRGGWVQEAVEEMQDVVDVD
ncbi:hypothetical protein JDV02_004161 [Purpureocillium takamizusanense]|nr:uncharacterized protein JDV02_004161 [Purpureocillium takamizusanense]UNI17847.1 hypothetical protein JDV02_004161 [Purpureocillium takamizusanense]